MAGIEREPAEVRIPKSALDAFVVVLSGRAGACSGVMVPSAMRSRSWRTTGSSTAAPQPDASVRVAWSCRVPVVHCAAGMDHRPGDELGAVVPWELS